MRRDTVELAQQGLEVYSRELTPYYEAIRQRTLGSLAMGEAPLDDLKTEITHGEANYQLVTSFLNLLPHSRNMHFMEAGSLEEARYIQSAVIWYLFRDGSTGREAEEPYYVIGEAHYTPRYFQGTDTVWLLAPAASATDNGKIVGIHTWEPLAEQADEMMEAGLLQDYTPEEVRKLYDENTGALLLKPSSPRSMATSSALYEWQPRIKQLLDRMFPQRVIQKRQAELAQSFALPVTSSTGRQTKFRTTADGEKVYRLHDDQLALFNVFHFLNRLATKFGKTDELMKLLEEYSPSEQR